MNKTKNKRKDKQENKKRKKTCSDRHYIYSRCGTRNIYCSEGSQAVSPLGLLVKVGYKQA